ncbi:MULTISPECIES: hypothetical protein [unclassified Streptomyces]|uniref:hypothetical protein n=1 Tax=unclassified Streptomyces TaxID=2593676 RepID=UPI003BB525B1
MSDVVAERVQQVRKKRGWTVKQLAEQCAAIGAPELTAQALYNIGNGRRDDEGRRRRFVTTDEVAALALALDVAPVHLMVPPDADDEAEYRITPTSVVNVRDVRAWFRGYYPVLGRSVRDFHGEAPESEYGVMQLAPQQRTDPDEAIRGIDELMQLLSDARAKAVADKEAGGSNGPSVD